MIDKIKKELRTLYFSLFEIENSQINTNAKSTTKKLIDDEISKYLNTQILNNGKPTVVTSKIEREKGNPIIGKNTFYHRNEKQILEHLTEVRDMTAKNLVVKFDVSNPTATEAIKTMIILKKAIKIKSRPITVRAI